MRFFNRKSLPQHRRASTSAICPKLGLTSFCLFLLSFLPCLLPQKASADAVFINFPGFNIDNSDLNTGFKAANDDGSASGGSFSGNLIRVGMFGTPRVIIKSTSGGTGATATAIISGGVVTGFTITNSGSGYSAGTTSISITGSRGASATASATISGGAVTGITITNGGSGYENIDPTSLIGGLTAITSPSAILANLESKFTQYTSFTFLNTLLDGNDASVYPTLDPDTGLPFINPVDGLPLLPQPLIGANLRGQDIYLLFYNAATTDAADQLAIFRMKESSMNGPTGVGLAGIFSTESDSSAIYESSFNLFFEEADMLLGQYVADTFVLGKLSGGVGQITSATTKSMNAGATSTYQILSNNGAGTYALTSKPSWASIDAATGLITLSPGASIDGSFSLTFTASNSLTGNTATGSLTVTVQTTTGPAFTSSSAVAAIAGIAFSHTITTDALATFTSPSVPAGLTLDSATGVLSGIPRNAVPVNIEIVAARVSNPTQTSTQNLTLTVSSPTLAIAALVSGQLTRTAGTAYTIPVTPTAGFPVDSSSITPAISGVTYSSGNLLISSTAAPFAKGTTSQAITLTLNRTSGLGGSTVSASLAFNLRLIAPAPTTLTTAGPFEVNVREGYSLQLATDVSTICPNQNIEIVGTLPLGLTNITAGLRKTGVITGTNTNTTSPWQFPVDVVADTSTFYEGGGTMTFSNVIFQLRNPVPPLITSSLSKLAGVGKFFPLFKLEASGNPSTFTASGLPPGLALTEEFNITGTPTQAGIYDVRLDAYNSYRPGSTLASDLQSGTATLRIFVSGSKPTTATPLSGSSNLQVGNAASFSMLSAQELGLRISGYGFPPGLSINSSTGMVTGTPTTAGTYSVTIFIQNGKGWIKKTVPLTVR